MPIDEDELRAVPTPVRRALLTMQGEIEATRVEVDTMAGRLLSEIGAIGSEMRTCFRLMGIDYMSHVRSSMNGDHDARGRDGEDNARASNAALERAAKEADKLADQLEEIRTSPGMVNPLRAPAVPSDPAKAFANGMALLVGRLAGSGVTGAVAAIGAAVGTGIILLVRWAILAAAAHH